MNITGLVIPTSWYKTIKRDNGKPDLLAIIILAHVVNEYTQPREDLLMLTYGEMSNLFGCSKREATEAVIRLEKKGYIKRVFRTIEVNGMKMASVLFIELFPDLLPMTCEKGASEPD